MGNVPLKPARPQSSTCAPSGALCQPHNRTHCRTCIAPIPPISSPARPAACSCLRLPCASASNKWIQTSGFKQVDPLACSCLRLPCASASKKWIQTSGSACLLMPQATMRKCFKQVDSNKWIQTSGSACLLLPQATMRKCFKQVDPGGCGVLDHNALARIVRQIPGMDASVRGTLLPAYLTASWLACLPGGREQGGQGCLVKVLCCSHRLALA